MTSIWTSGIKMSGIAIRFSVTYSLDLCSWPERGGVGGEVPSEEADKACAVEWSARVSEWASTELRLQTLNNSNSTIVVVALHPHPLFFFLHHHYKRILPSPAVTAHATPTLFLTCQQTRSITLFPLPTLPVHFTPFTSRPPSGPKHPQLQHRSSHSNTSHPHLEQPSTRWTTYGRASPIGRRLIAF